MNHVLKILFVLALCLDHITAIACNNPCDNAICSNSTNICIPYLQDDACRYNGSYRCEYIPPPPLPLVTLPELPPLPLETPPLLRRLQQKG